ncbi:hypothetical protein O1611_g6634 [Lasiodiplodia mahajangana]|uniref:Uncharacterized protein n=1 Tax=Lasiodiplodia mahajangana TaxID=1108764 RepID=A0ACC2JIE5_9PEZI|nr:hypothetical protein O1611_g6634 [Lasiodiplodia mahajangana]
MILEPTDDELEWLFEECEAALSIVRRTIAACPSDLVAKVALPPLETSLRHLIDDVQGWLKGVNERPLSAEHFDRLRQFVKRSRLSIIDPQAGKIGLDVSKLKPAEQRNKNPSPYSSILYMFTLFVVQGFGFAAAPGLYQGHFVIHALIFFSFLSSPCTIQSWEDQDHFITFGDAPGDWEYPHLPEKQHSCLLAEIIQADTFIRPRLVCRDVSNEKFIVAFYPDNEAEMPRLLEGFKVGYTIAIFYPIGHMFLDGTVGVRVEQTDKVLV